MSIVSDASIAGRSSAAPEKTRCETHFSELVDNDRCMISSALVLEKNEPIVIRPCGTCRITCDQCRVTSTTRIMKFDVRAYISRDRRVISSAVVVEMYETAIEAVVTACNAGGDCRGACIARVKEV